MKLPKLNINLKPFVKDVEKWWAKYGPKVLTGASIVCWSGAVVSGIKATPKAMELIAKRKEELETDKLTVVETVKTAGKCYIPTVALATMGAGSSIGAAVGYEQKLVSAASAVELARRAAANSDLYRQKAQEIIGEKKDKQIREEVAKEIVNRDYELSPHGCIVNDPNGVLFKESWSGIVFRDDFSKVDHLTVQLSHQQKTAYDSSVAYYDWMAMLGLPYPDCGLDLVWDATSDGDIVMAEFTKLPANSSDNPYREDVYVIEYNLRPSTETTYKY